MQVKMRLDLKTSGLVIAVVVALFEFVHCRNKLRVAMPNVTPHEEDNYLCIAYSVKDLVPTGGQPIYITKFEADSDANKTLSLPERGDRRQQFRAGPGGRCVLGSPALRRRSAPAALVVALRVGCLVVSLAARHLGVAPLPWSQQRPRFGWAGWWEHRASLRRMLALRST